MGYLGSNPCANTPEMESIFFGSNRSWHRTLPEYPELYRSSKETVLTSPRKLYSPLSRKCMCGMRGKIKPRTNDSCIEDGQPPPLPSWWDIYHQVIHHEQQPSTPQHHKVRSKYASFWNVCAQSNRIASTPSLPLKVRVPIKSPLEQQRIHIPSSFFSNPFIQQTYPNQP